MPRYERQLVAVSLFFILTTLPVATFAKDLPSSVGKQPTIRSLSLQDALNRLKDSPSFKAAAKYVEIQDGLAEQAGLLPNPDVAIEVGNFGGKDELESFEGSEITVAISQLIELGGKRSARKIFANHEKDLAERDFQIQSQDLQMEVMEAFYALLASQEKLKQTKQLLSLAEQGYQAVADRVEAGKVSPIQELRASVELNIARNAWEASQRHLIQSRQDLSSLWGAPKPDFDIVIGTFEDLQEPPPWEELQAAFPNNPELKRWEAEQAHKKANLDLEHANSIPDVTFSLGIRNFQETDDSAFVAGLEFPLPFFDRNQGGRKAAQAEVAQSAYQRDAGVAKLSSDLQSSYQELLSTLYQARTIKQDIKPAAEKANAAAQIGYQRGKFDYLEALDAQRTLFEVEAQYIDAISAYHTARLNILRRIGRIDLFSIF